MVESEWNYFEGIFWEIIGYVIRGTLRKTLNVNLNVVYEKILA